jgi:hypothetical protein
MKKSLFTLITVACLGTVTFPDGRALAGNYPVAPPITYITLPLSSFIASVPYTSWTGLADPGNPVIGDNLNQHPGAFYTGQPSVGEYFIGVFGAPVDTSDLTVAVCLWETTYGGLGGTAGPQVELGRWNGTSFHAWGNPQTASYSDTGVADSLPMEINSSVIPLDAFGINPGFPGLVNAVKIEVTDMFAHNQVIAVAVIPEPCASFLLSLALVCLLGLIFHHSHAVFRGSRT